MYLVTLRLSGMEAAEVHTLCDLEAKRYHIMADVTASVPAISQMFRDAAERCSAIATQIEEQVPDFAKERERP